MHLRWPWPEEANNFSFTNREIVLPCRSVLRSGSEWRDELAGLVAGFGEAMRAERRGVCLVAIGTESAHAALAAGFSVLKVGEEPWFDLAAPLLEPVFFMTAGTRWSEGGPSTSSSQFTYS